MKSFIASAVQLGSSATSFALGRGLLGPSLAGRGAEQQRPLEVSCVLALVLRRCLGLTPLPVKGIQQFQKHLNFI